MIVLNLREHPWGLGAGSDDISAQLGKDPHDERGQRLLRQSHWLRAAGAAFPGSRAPGT